MNEIKEECEDFLCAHQAHQARIGSTIESRCEHPDSCLDCDNAVWQDKGMLAAFGSACKEGHIDVGWKKEEMEIPPILSLSQNRDSNS